MGQSGDPLEMRWADALKLTTLVTEVLSLWPSVGQAVVAVNQVADADRQRLAGGLAAGHVPATRMSPATFGRQRARWAKSAASGQPARMQTDTRRYLEILCTLADERGQTGYRDRLKAVWGPPPGFSGSCGGRNDLARLRADMEYLRLPPSARLRKALDRDSDTGL